MGGRQQAPPRGAAAAAYLADLVRGPGRSGEVVALRSDAALVVIGSGPLTRLVAIADCSAGATRTANAILLAQAPTVVLGAAVRVGDGALQLAGRGYPIVRYWPSAAGAVALDPAALQDLTEVGAPALSAEVLGPLRSALTGGSGLAAAARQLVGRGPGSTPAGDDVLAGVALGLRVAGRQTLLEQLVTAIDGELADRTTALSADLLRAALAGHASPEVLALVRGLRPGVLPAVRRRAVRDVLRLGHSSGADLVQGLAVALRATPLSPSPRRHPDLPAQSRRMAER